MGKETSEILRDLRKQKGATQSDIAKILGFSTTAYQNYERGINEPSNKSLCILADFYGVTTDYLLGREKPPEQLQQTQAEQEQELLETYFTLEPQKRAMFLEMLLGIVKNGSISKSGLTIPVQKAARAKPGDKQESIHAEQMTLEEFEEMMNLPDANEGM